MTLLTPEPVIEQPKRVCKRTDCDAECAPRVQFCYDDWLARQPPVVRAAAAVRRLSLIPEDLRRARVPADQWPEGRRWCAGCQTFVLLRHCTGSRCKGCASIAGHKSRLVSEFGIDEQTYAHLMIVQNGRCAICRSRPVTARLAVDHDHRCCKEAPYCGKCTRGLLCSRCNHELLGAAHDSLQILVNAVAYMRTPPYSGEWELPPLEVEENRARYGEDDAPPF